MTTAEVKQLVERLTEIADDSRSVAPRSLVLQAASALTLLAQEREELREALKEEKADLAALLTIDDFGSEAIEAWVCAQRDIEKPPKGELSSEGKAILKAIRARAALKDT